MDELIQWLGGSEAVKRTALVGLLVAARVAPLTLLAPWLSARSMSPVLRIVVAAALVLALCPVALAGAPPIPSPPIALAFLVVNELLVGSVFGLCSALPLHALGWAGRAADRALGSVDALEGETSPLSELYLWMSVALFLALGGHRYAISALAAGLGTVPVGDLNSLSLADVGLSSARLVGNAIAFAVSLGVPALVVVAILEVGAGLAARSSRGSELLASVPLRAAAALGASLLGLSLLVGSLPAAFRQAIDSAADLVLVLGLR